MQATGRPDLYTNSNAALKACEYIEIDVSGSRKKQEPFQQLFWNTDKRFRCSPSLLYFLPSTSTIRQSFLNHTKILLSVKYLSLKETTNIFKINNYQASHNLILKKFAFNHCQFTKMSSTWHRSMTGFIHLGFGHSCIPSNHKPIMIYSHVIWVT